MGIAAIAAGLAIGPAHAQEWHRRQAPPPGMERAVVQPPPLREAEAPRRELLRQDFQQTAPMSQEERRQLRRDIGEVGREIYRRQPGHGQR